MEFDFRSTRSRESSLGKRSHQEDEEINNNYTQKNEDSICKTKSLQVRTPRQHSMTISRTSSYISQPRQDSIMSSMLESRQKQNDLTPEEEIELEERMYVMLRFSKKYKKEQVRRANLAWTEGDNNENNNNNNEENILPNLIRKSDTKRYRAFSTQPKSSSIKGLLDLSEIDRAHNINNNNNNVNKLLDRIDSNRFSDTNRPSQTIGDITFHRIRTFSETPIVSNREFKSSINNPHTLKGSKAPSVNSSIRSILKKEPTQFSLQTQRTRQTSTQSRKIAFNGNVSEIIILPIGLNGFDQKSEQAKINNPLNTGVHTIEEDEEEQTEDDYFNANEEKEEEEEEEDIDYSFRDSDSDNTEDELDSESDERLEEARKNKILNQSRSTSIYGDNNNSISSKPNSIINQKLSHSNKLKKWVNEANDNIVYNDYNSEYDHNKQPITSFMSMGSQRMFGPNGSNSSQDIMLSKNIKINTKNISIIQKSTNLPDTLIEEEEEEYEEEEEEVVEVEVEDHDYSQEQQIGKPIEKELRIDSNYSLNANLKSTTTPTKSSNLIRRFKEKFLSKSIAMN